MSNVLTFRPRPKLVTSNQDEVVVPSSVSFDADFAELCPPVETGTHRYKVTTVTYVDLPAVMVDEFAANATEFISVVLPDTVEADDIRARNGRDIEIGRSANSAAPALGLMSTLGADFDDVLSGTQETLGRINVERVH